MPEKEAFMIELTEQQQRAVDTEPTPQLIDPRNRKAYVLLGAEQFAPPRVEHAMQASEERQRLIGQDFAEAGAEWAFDLNARDSHVSASPRARPSSSCPSP